METFIFNHIKHFYRKCPRIINIADDMLARHKTDDVYETCQTCENAKKSSEPKKI
jgi:hypothetical protein